MSQLPRTHKSFLCFGLPELKEVAERAQNQYRSEKQKRKEMELRVSAMEEELQDLKSDKENLERVGPLHVVYLCLSESSQKLYYCSESLQ